MAHQHPRTRPHRQPLFTLSNTLLFTICSFLVITAAALAHLRANTLQQSLPAQMVFDPSAPVTLDAWKEIALPGTAHPPPSFAIGNYFYAQLKRPDKILYAKQQADGSLTPWTTSSFTHGDSDHGYTAVSTGDTAYHFRNGHIIQYVINATDGSVTAMPELEKTSLQGFHGVDYVWDTAVYVPFGGTDNYIFHLGGFDGPNGPHQYDLNRLHRIRLPVPSSNAQFDVVDNNVPTQHPEKAAFYRSPGQAYGFIYLSNRIGSEIFRLKVQSDGSVGTWDTVAHQPSGTGNNRGDMFIIGNSLFDIRGSKVYSATIAAADGSLSAWDDSPPDLPADQVDFSWAGDHNEGAGYGIINEYIYVVGPSKVFYSHIQGNIVQPPAGATNTPVPNVNTGPVVNIPDFSSRAENKSPATNTFGVTLALASLSSGTANELSTLFSGLNVTLRLVNPPPAVAQDPTFSNLNSKFNWYFTFFSYDAMRQFLTAYYTRSDAKPVTVGLTAQADATQTQGILSQFPQVKFEAQEFGIWPRGDVQALLGRVSPPALHAVSFRLNSVNSPIFDDVKLLFDTMFDAVKDIAGGSVKINYPANTSLTLVDTKFSSNIDGIARKTGVLSGAIVAALQGTKISEAPIRTIIAGDFSGMSPEEKPIIKAFAQFIFESPQLYYPWTHPGNGEPFDKGEGNIKPAWGIAGIKNGKVYAIFTNTSDQPITLKFPNKYTIPDTESVYSTTRGVGNFIQGNQISLAGKETIALVSGIVAAATSTPFPPGVPTFTPPPAPGDTTVPINTPTITLTPKPTKTPRPTYTPAPVIKRVVATIPVMAIKLGKPTESQSFLNWLTVWFQFILPGTSPAAKPTPTPTPTPGEPTATPLPAGVPSPTPVGYNPTPTPVGFNPTATPTPSPTPTPEPLPCPGSSSYCPYGAPNCFATLHEHLPSWPNGDPSPPNHPDLNLSRWRGYVQVNEPGTLISYGNGSADPPQLLTIFRNHASPAISSTWQVYDWDWVNHQKGSLLSDFPVTLAGLTASPGENLYPPFASATAIGEDLPVSTDPFQVLVLFADANHIDLKYDRVDSAASGYLLHVENVCVDPNLVSLYNTKNYNTSANRTSLIALRTRDSFGTARSGEVLVAIRANGRFLDPRSKTWWPGF